MRRVFPFVPMALILLAGCGGGSGANTNPPSGEGVSPSAVTGPSHLQMGVRSNTLQYKVTVSGTSNTAVNWSVDDPSLATIDSSGVVTPSSSKTGTVTITATAVADATKKSSVNVPVVDWILAGVLPMVVDVETNRSTVLLQPITTLLEQCAWSNDHLNFACTELSFSPSATLPTQIGLFKTDGTAAGTSQTKLLDLQALGGMQFVENPHFSPDGTKLIFDGLGLMANGGLPIWGAWVVNVDGQSAPMPAGANNTGLPSLFNVPRYTPDGTGITYDSNGTVWLMRADGTNAHPLIPGPASNAVFTPDMSSIFYNTNGTVYRANGDGSQGVQVGIAGDQILDVSPNGQSILVMNGTLQGASNFIADLNGNHRRSVMGALWGSW